MTQLSITRAVGVSVRVALDRLFWTSSGDVTICIMMSVMTLLYVIRLWDDVEG